MAKALPANIRQALDRFDFEAAASTFNRKKRTWGYGRREKIPHAPHLRELGQQLCEAAALHGVAECGGLRCERKARDFLALEIDL